MAPSFLRRHDDPTRHTGRDEAAAPGVLDLSHLARYTIGNKELEEELLRLFRAQMRVQSAAVRHADDADAWKFATHTLKGVARSIGAWRIGAAAERLEGVGPAAGESSQTRDERARLLSALEAETAACEREIDRLLGDGDDDPQSGHERRG